MPWVETNLHPQTFYLTCIEFNLGDNTLFQIFVALT